MQPLSLTTLYLAILIALLQNTPAFAQWQSSLHADLGANNVSEGVFIRMADVAGYRFGNNIIEAGIQVDLMSNRDVFFSGFLVKATREFMIRNRPISVTGLYAFTPFSSLMHEINRGVVASLIHKQFHFELGTGFRTYAYNKKARDQYSIDQNARITEKWNTLYTISYHLKSADHPWNISLAVTNQDYFIVQQETNPILKLSGICNLDDRFSVFLDAFYQQAGLFNINIHYFGFYIRPGIVWHIN